METESVSMEERKLEPYGHQGTIRSILKHLYTKKVEVMLTKREHRPRFYSLHRAIKFWRALKIDDTVHVTLYSDSKECDNFINLFGLFNIEFRIDEAVLVKLSGNPGEDQIENFVSLDGGRDKFRIIKFWNVRRRNH
ncbi:hypothetical protein ACOME3_006002 [Neoechinorhynchus agilis]